MYECIRGKRKKVATYMVKCIDEVRRKVEWEKNDFFTSAHTEIRSTFIDF